MQSLRLSSKYFQLLSHLASPWLSFFFFKEGNEQNRWSSFPVTSYPVSWPNNHVKFPIHHFPPSVSWGSLCMHVLVYILCGGGDIKALSTHKSLSISIAPKLLLHDVLGSACASSQNYCWIYIPSPLPPFFCKCIWGDVTQEVGNCPQWNVWDMKMSKITIQDLICFLLSIAVERLLPHHLWWLGLLRGLNSVTQLPGHNFLVRNR